MSTSTNPSRSSQILTLLVDGGYLSVASQSMLERYVERWGVSPYEAVLQTEVLSEIELADALAEILRIDRVFHVTTMSVSLEALRLIGFKRARQWVCLAIGEMEGRGGKFEVIMADPTRRDWLEALQQELQRELTLAVAERSDIVGAIDELYPLSDQLPGLYGK